MLEELNMTAFKYQIATEKLFIIDLYADWCKPCHTFTPLVAEIAAEYQGRATFKKCNAWVVTSFLSKYKIRSLPTLLFFKRGKVVETIVGTMSKEYIKQKIEEHI